MDRKKKERTSPQVTLLIFSGRPDPELMLTADETERLVGHLKTALQGDEVNPPPERGLGYRGFLLRDLPLDELKRQPTRVFRRTVTLELGDRRSWGDAGLEEWLLEKAKDSGYGELLEPS